MLRSLFVYDVNKKQLHINDVPEEINDRTDYYCMACGGKMIARKGKERVHHFAKPPKSSGCGTDYHDRIVMQISAHLNVLIGKKKKNKNYGLPVSVGKSMDIIY